MGSDTTQPGTCAACGAHLRGGAAGPASRYCSNACRQRAYRLRLKTSGLPSAASASLQAQANSFVGRADELVEVARLARETRLLTLTGAPGAGKTRLAGEYAVAEQRGGRCAVVPVELAGLPDGRSVTDSVDAAVREAEPGRQPVLLVLDTCEHVLDDCGRALAGLLADRPDTRVLATSREPLRLPGEVLFPVRGLRCGAGPDADPVRLPAVRLFADRARAVLPDFHLTEDNAAEIAELCAELDGLPLAIELAAGLVPAFPVAEIRRRLDDRLDLLTGGWRTAEPRHRSLRAAIDWSHRLLGSDEQVLLRVLAVLPGGFGPDTATALAADRGVPAGRVSGVLVALEAKSLIVRDARTPAAARFRLPSSIRCHAGEQLVAHGEEPAVRAALVRWLVSITGTFAETGVLSSATAGRLDRDGDTLECALASATGADRQLLAAAADALDLLHGRPARGRLAATLPDPSAEGQLDVPAFALATAAILAAGSDAHGFDSRSTDSHGSDSHGSDSHGSDSHGTASTLARAALGRPGQRDRMAILLTLLGPAPDAVPALDVLRECLHNCYAAEDPLLVAIALRRAVERLAGAADPAHGARLIAQALDLLPVRDLPGPFRTFLHTAGVLALAAGDHAQAGRWFTELAAESTHPAHIALALEGLAVTAAGTRRPGQAVRLAAASAALGGGSGAADRIGWPARVREAIDAARAALSAAQASAAAEEGRLLPARQLLDQALDQTHDPVDRRSAGDDQLSEREWEVAALVAQGLTNRQIAARLYVSVRTVETHVRNIRTELGLTTRAHIAAWTARRAPRPAAAPVVA